VSPEVRLVLPDQLFRDHRDVFAGASRCRMIADLHDRKASVTQAAHARRAARWLA
jgi:hypothetical protein